jgi:aminopeptidase
VLDPDAFAALVCDWCLEVRPGQTVVIDSTTAAEPALAALAGALLDRGAWPEFAIALPGHERRFFEHALDRHLDGEPPAQRAVYETMDAWCHLVAPTAREPLAGVDPGRLSRFFTAMRPLNEVRLAKRWAISIWPTAALAEEAGTDLETYSDFLERALFLDRPDPIAAWRELSARQQELVDRLASAREVRIQSAGTDLTLTVAGRRWQNSDGRRNMPSGEVFTSPLEDSANGQISFDVPSNLGARVSGVVLSFVDGVVTSASATEGDDLLQAQLATDPGARRLGELGIGTNAGIDRATGSTLLDEKIGGSVHLALGNSYPECGGSNESAIHWDLICDLRGGGEITVDGETLSRDGVFV